MKKIIAIVGHIGSGKDTAAKFFIDTYNYKKVSFADSLKDALSSIFVWDRQLLEGTSAESRNWRNKKDVFWSNALGFEVTPRLMMQTIGTDLFRHHFSNYIWVYSSVLKIEKSTSSVVVADVRFPEEYNALKELGATFIRMQRTVPDWEDTARKALSGDEQAIAHLKENKIHESEWYQLGFVCDYSIDNSGSIIQMRNQLAELKL